MSDELEKFYSKPFKFSYSSLNKLLYSPQSFYSWYILGEKEDSMELYLLEGRLVHCLLLEKDKFKENFTILPGNIPTATSKKVVEGMYRLWKNDGKPAKSLKDYSKDILEWLVVDNTYQNIKDDKDLNKTDAKTGDIKRLDKILVPQCTEYFTHLTESDDKTVIDQDIYDKCKDAVDLVRANAKLKDLLKLDESDFELQEVHNELMLSMNLKNYPFGLKGIIDNLVINHQNKEVFINDFKTTSKSLAEFSDSVHYYKYWLQAAIYSLLVQGYLKQQGIDDLDKWEIVFHFVVIDKYNQTYAFPVLNNTMSDWQHDLKVVLEKAKYHYKEKDYNLPYEFALGQVKL